MYLDYIFEYLNKDKKPYAFLNLVGRLDSLRSHITQDQTCAVIDKCLAFSDRYEKAWWWQKNKVISQAINDKSFAP